MICVGRMTAQLVLCGHTIHTHEYVAVVHTWIFSLLVKLLILFTKILSFHKHT